MKRLCSALLAGILAGCATVPKVQTESKQGTDFSRYKTYALMPLTTSGTTSDPGLVLRVSGAAEQAAKDALAAKGLQPASREQADLALHLIGRSVPRVQVTDWGYHPAPVAWGGRYYYPGYPGYSSVNVSSYDEKTLTVEIYDNRTKDLVWVGWVKSTASGPVKSEDVQDAVRRILAEFPPGSKPQT